MTTEQTTPLESELYTFILFYRTCLVRAINFLNEKSKREKNFHAHEKSGYLDKEQKVSFSFHGIGCTIETDEFSLSVDFDQFGRCDGFRASIIYAFFRHNTIDQFQTLKTLGFKEIDPLLKELANQGLILKREFFILSIPSITVLLHFIASCTLVPLNSSSISISHFLPSVIFSMVLRMRCTSLKK